MSTSSQIPFFKDRSDLRLSARYVFHQSVVSASSSNGLLPSFIAVRSCLKALLGSSSATLLKNAHLQQVIIEEGNKLYGRGSESLQQDQSSEDTIVSSFFPMEESLFVKVAERIYLIVTSSVENTSNDDDDDQQLLGVEFWKELMNLEEQRRKLVELSSTGNPCPRHDGSCCISRSTFIQAATTSSRDKNKTTAEIFLSRETAETLWKNLVDCEMILSSDLPQKDSRKSVSFAFSQVDPNHRKNDSCPMNITKHDAEVRSSSKTKSDDGECVSRRTIERCLHLGSRLKNNNTTV